jgi:hypothetical protein
MSRTSSFLMAFISLVLLVIFQWQDLGGFWSTHDFSSGHYYQQTFFKAPQRNPKSSLQAVEGRLLKNEDNEVIYQFKVPLKSRIYLQPSLVKQNSLQSQSQKIFPYKNLNTMHLELPQSNAQVLLFHGAAHPRKRIEVTSYLKEQSLFRVVLQEDPALLNTERAIGSLEIFVVDEDNSSLPNLPRYFLFWIAPLLGCWFVTTCLNYSSSLALSLNTMHLLLIYVLAVLRPELATVLVLAEVVTAGGLILLHSLFSSRPPPMAPLIWMVFLPALYWRWQEILIQFTRPLQDQPFHDYYQHALSMDLWSSRGFFAALYPQGSLYPLLIKLTGFVFGFSFFHVFYLSLCLSFFLIGMTMLLTRKLVGSNWAAFFVGVILSVNPFLIQESTLQRPDVLGACLALCYFYLVFSKITGSVFYGLLRGSVLLTLIWTHLSFAPLALGLLALDMVYQRRQYPRAEASRRVGKYYSLKSGLVSLVLVLVGIGPGLYQNWQVYRSFLPESTYYVSRVANYEFSDQTGFPASLDVQRLGNKAPNYRYLSIREYFLSYHRLPEILGASVLGASLIILDSIGALGYFASGENILDVLIYGLSSQQNLLPILGLFILEILMALFLAVFAWLRYRRYRVLLSILGLWMLPYTFFHGIFLLKGYATWQFTLDHQILLICVPLLALITVDAAKWLIENRSRWLI